MTGGYKTVVNYGPQGRSFDLFNFKNGSAVSLGGFNLKAGVYNAIKLNIDDNSTVVVDTTSGLQTMPLAFLYDDTSQILFTNAFTVPDTKGVTTVKVDFNPFQRVIYYRENYWLKENIFITGSDTSEKVFNINPKNIDMLSTQPPHPNGVTTVDTTPVNGLVALYSVQVGAGSSIDSNISILGRCDDTDENKACLDSSVELSLGSNITQSAASVFKADSMIVRANSTLRGKIEGNDFIIDPSSSIAGQVTTLGELPTLPVFMSGTVVLDDVDAARSPLAKGIYRQLNLNDNETLELSGGYYHFENVILNSNGTLRCLDSCYLLVKGSFTMGNNSKIASASGNANAFYIFVNGSNAINAAPKAVQLGNGTSITANIYSPYGTYLAGNNSVYKGLLIAREISFGDNSQVTGGTVGLVFSKDYVAQARYHGNALQFYFDNEGPLKMINSVDPRYVYHGNYTFNILNNEVYINYSTVDKIDPDCFTCPVIESYPATAFVINDAYKGFEYLGLVNGALKVRVLSSNEVIEFAPRSGFGPYDE